MDDDRLLLKSNLIRMQSLLFHLQQKIEVANIHSLTNKPPINAWKKSCTTLPTKVTDDPLIDERKLSTKLVPIEYKKNDSKAHIQKGDTTAHQTCWQSLSPDWKVCIQESNTAPHQKCRQSLLLNSKVRIQKDNTTATISSTQFESSYSGEQYCRSTKTPTISLTRFESLYSGN